MAEAAVVVLVAAQRVGDVPARLAQEAGCEQPALQQPGLIEKEAVSRGKCIVHSPEPRDRSAGPVLNRTDMLRFRVAGGHR